MCSIKVEQSDIYRESITKVQACFGFKTYSKFSPIGGLCQGLPGRLLERERGGGGVNWCFTPSPLERLCQGARDRERGRGEREKSSVVCCI